MTGIKLKCVIMRDKFVYFNSGNDKKFFQLFLEAETVLDESVNSDTLIMMNDTSRLSFYLKEEAIALKTRYSDELTRT